MTSTTKRAYNSPARAAGAAATRGRILDAARKLFAQRGYSGATLDAVAAEAGVAVQRIRQLFGGKAGLLRAQLDSIDEIGGITELRAVLDDPAATPSQMARAVAHFLRRLYDGAGDMLRAASSAGESDPELAAMHQGGLRRHRTGISGVAARWEAIGVLRPGLGAREAAAIMATVSGYDAYLTLRSDWDWSPEVYETWLVEAIERLVLAPAVWSHEAPNGGA